MKRHEKVTPPVTASSKGASRVPGPNSQPPGRDETSKIFHFGWDPGFPLLRVEGDIKLGSKSLQVESTSAAWSSRAFAILCYRV